MLVSEILKAIKESVILEKALKSDLVCFDDFDFIDADVDSEGYKSLLVSLENSGKEGFDDIDLRVGWGEILYDTPVIQFSYIDDKSDEHIYRLSVRELVNGELLKNGSVKIDYHDADKSEELILTFYCKC
jgi:hypothetical protein